MHYAVQGEQSHFAGTAGVSVLHRIRIEGLVHEVEGLPLLRLQEFAFRSSVMRVFEESVLLGYEAQGNEA